MKLECVTEKLKDAVSRVEKTAVRNATLPILESILLIAKGKLLTLRATNLDVGVEITIPAQIEKEGVVAVPAKTLNMLVSGISDSKKIIIDESSGNIIIGYNENTTLIKSLQSDEFPTLPTFSKENSINIDIEKLIDGIKSVIYASSISDIKQELSSVYIYQSESDLIFVSTDSFRLAEKKVNIKKENNFNGVIIPFKNALEIIRVFEGYKGETNIYFNKNQISIILDEIYFTSRIIDGVFPDYKQIIPKESSTEIIVLKQDLINALKVSNIFSDKFNQVVMNISDKNIEIKTRNSDVGESNLNIDGTIKGDNLEINLNYKYIIDAFQSIHQDSVTMLFNGSNKPIIMKGIGDNSFMYLIMPMNK